MVGDEQTGAAANVSYDQGSLTGELTSFATLIEHLREERGFTFEHYKDTSLIRCAQRRMKDLGLGEAGQYVDYLQVHQDEYAILFDSLLINVTEFFRDSQAWDVLRGNVLDSLIAAKPADGPIRLWSAGCSTGEEAYSLAIMLAEHLGLDEFRERVKIFATDIDDSALSAARSAEYSQRALGNIGPQLLDAYFEQQGADRWKISSALRRAVVVGRNDLLRDAPISRIDLLVCRNVLMYFNTHAQEDVIKRFTYALQPWGVLFLGKAEMLLPHMNSYRALDGRSRLFVKSNDQRVDSLISGAHAPRYGGDELLEQATLSSTVAHLIVDAQGVVRQVNRRAQVLLGMSERDEGKILSELRVSYQPRDIRSAMQRALMDRRVVRVRDAVLLKGMDILTIDIIITPLTREDGSILGASVAFHDMSDEQRLRVERDELRASVDTLNNDLLRQAQEMSTTHEELASANEELETTNEELRSTVEELARVNDQLRAEYVENAQRENSGSFPMPD